MVRIDPPNGIILSSGVLKTGFYLPFFALGTTKLVIQFLLQLVHCTSPTLLPSQKQPCVIIR